MFNYYKRKDMLPIAPIKFPSFAPNQLLTAGHLNGMFRYLDEQSRLTRANLIGVGIVCGLQLKLDSAGTTLTITKGCGITTEGYLISTGEQSYVGYRPYNAEQPDFYEGFVTPEKVQKFPIDELVASSIDDDVTPLSKAYLKDKVVLLFVEMLRSDSKNCDPDSCDAKGAKVEVAYKALLVSRENALALNGGMSGNINTLNQDFFILPELQVPRYNVKSSNLTESATVLDGFLDMLSKEYIADIQEALSRLYETVKPLVIGEFATDPFKEFSSGFQNINSSSITTSQALRLQYFFDFVCDVVKAYTELRDRSLELYCQCMPDNGFPRHLLLGEVQPANGFTIDTFRHYFISSPVNCLGRHVANLSWLFRRLALMIVNFEIPNPQGVLPKLRNLPDDQIRITPSLFGADSLEKRAIPYYYKVDEGTPALYQNWSYQLSSISQAKRNLSYHSPLYNKSEIFITDPLRFDVEKFNFFRIEGHLGKPYVHALKNIQRIQKEYRLPFEVVAMSANVSAIRDEVAAITRPGGIPVLKEKYAEELRNVCTFQDLEALYDSLAAELKCGLCSQMKYFYSLERDNKVDLANNVPQVTLLQSCDPAFRVKADTLGQSFETFWQNVKDKPYITFNAFFSGSTLNLTAVVVRPDMSNALLYYIEMLSQTLKPNLSDFSTADFNTRFFDLQRTVMYIKSQMAQSDNDFAKEDVMDHLDALLYNCKLAAINALFRNYYLRWLYIIMLRKFGHYILSHPGIEHKAGVPRGGTFIIVYHEDEERAANRLTTNIAALSAVNLTAVSAVPATTVATAATGVISRADALKPSGERADISDSITSKLDSRITTLSSVNLKDKLAVSEKLNLLSGTKLTFLNEFTTQAKAIPPRQLAALDLLFDATFIRTPKRTFAEVVEALEDGVVIADFYLPYLTASDCPPVHYTVIETGVAEPGEQPGITIEKKEFCAKDEGTYKVEVTPEGGTVSGEGVETDDNNGNVFNPSKVDTGENASKNVVLKYTVDDKTAEITVTVFANPGASFSSSAGRIFSIRTFTNTSKFSQKAEWDFGDGGKMEGNSVTHDFLKPGTYPVSLTATNGLCSDTTTQRIVIRQPEPGPAEKECLSINNAVEGFQNLQKLDPVLFKVFVSKYQSYDSINAFFKDLEALGSVKPEEYMNFLKDKKIGDQLQGWLKELGVLLVARDSDPTMPLAMLVVLSSLAFYIACLNEGDITEEKTIRLDAAFEMIQGMVNNIQTNVQKYSVQQKSIVKQLRNFVVFELSQLKSSGENKTKANYENLLTRLVRLMSSMQL